MEERTDGICEEAASLNRCFSPECPWLFGQRSGRVMTTKRCVSKKGLYNIPLKPLHRRDQPGRKACKTINDQTDVK